MVACPGPSKEVCGHTFTNFGSHHDAYPTSYLTAAAAIGVERSDIDTFCTRLDKVLKKIHSGNLEKPLAGGDSKDTEGEEGVNNRVEEVDEAAGNVKASGDVA